VLLLAAGVLGLLDARDVYDVTLTAALATAVGVVAVSIAFGAMVKRRVRGLVPLGVVLVAALAAAALSPVSLSAGMGEKDERPLHAAELEHSYEFGIGHYAVDLTDVALASGTTKVDVELGIGDLLVQVPEHAALEIHAHADGGQVTVLGETDEGTSPDEHVSVPGSTPTAPVLAVDAEVGFGHVEVRRG
jgi:hypothetical protein